MYKLRELRREDVAAINGWRADPELIGFLGAPFRFIGPEVDEAWFDSYLSSRGSCIRCAVVEEGDPGTILGLVTLAGIDWVCRSAVLHIMIGEAQNRGKGMGSFAVEAMPEHAFDDMGLHRVELSVLASNARAKRLYEKEGFVLEGTKRRAAFKSGRYCDMDMMAILVDEWRLRKAGASKEEGR